MQILGIDPFLVAVMISALKTVCFLFSLPACARVFYKHGCRVILAGRSEEKLDAVRKALLKSQVQSKQQE